MSTILFVTWDGGGNVPPVLGIAAELQARGHAVRVIGHPSQEAAVAGRGLEFVGFPSARPFDSTRSTSPIQVLATLSERAMGSDVLAELDEHPADLVVVDCLLFGVMDALRRAGREYAVIGHLFDGYLRRAVRGPLGLLLRLRGLRPLDLIDAGRPTLVASLSELDAGHGEVTHIGPVVGGVPASPSEPTVLISLSTFAYPSLTKTWQRVLDAVDGLDARVIATVGPSVDLSALRVPAEVEIHRWLSHEEVLPQVSLVVGHGGHATTMAALAHDLPLLVMPLDGKGDQPSVGRALERAGVGRTLSRTSSPTRIRAAIDDLLLGGPHREAAAELGQRVRELDGRRRGADLLESLTLRRT